MLALTIVGLVLGVGLRAVDAQEVGDADIAAVDIEVLRTGSGTAVVPVRVTVVSRRAVDGRLQLESPDTNVSWELPVALAANSEVEQVFVVPTNGRSLLSLSAALLVDGVEVADDDSDGVNAATNAVGIIGLTNPGDRVRLSPDVGDASVIELDDLSTLSTLDTVIVSPAGLASLTEGEQSRLLQWTAAGRQLAVADEPGSIDGQLPTAWRSDRSFVAAGTGFVRYLGVDWRANVPPGVSTASNPQMAAGWFQPSAPELLSDAGFRVPGLSAMALLLLVYLVLAGPVTFVVLTQINRQTLAWVVVPALAVVFAVGVFGVGRFLSSGRGDGYASVVEVSPAGASLTDSLLIADDGQQTLELPEGWSLQSTGLTTGNGQVGSPVVVAPTRTSTDLRFDIDTGSGGTAVVRGANPDFDGSIEIIGASIEGDSLRGSVVNTTGERLDEVTVMVGERVTSVGSVEDGARGEFIIDLSVERNGFAPELRTWDVDPRDGWQFGPRQRDDDSAINDGPANGSAWLEWRASRLGTSVPEGMITAVGWSRDLDASLLDGTGRTAVVTHAALPRFAGPALPAHVRTVQLQVPGQDRFGNFDGFDDGRSGLVSQFIRQPGADTSTLAIVVENQIAEVELWTGDGVWRSLELDDRGGLASVGIPEEAWLDDVLTVRYSISNFFGEPGQLSTRLQVANDRTQPAALLPAGERSRRTTEFGADPFDQEPQFGSESEAALDDAGAFTGTGEIFGTYDVWLLELDEGDQVRVEMDATESFIDGPQLDPFLVVRDPSGSPIAENDDANGLNSALDFTAESAGTYEIEARPLGGSASAGSYELRIESSSEGEDQ